MPLALADYMKVFTISASPEPITDVKVKLVGEDGNAFVILGKVSKEFRQAGYDLDFKEYQTQAMSGDYDHLLITTMTYVNVE